MNDCITCGRKIRLRALRVAFNRKRGVAHWIEPMDGGGCPCLKDWAWTRILADKSRPTITEQKIGAWNAANPVNELPIANRSET